MSTYAIGDLQGCFDQFQALLDKISFDPVKDQLWLTGDLINRGPKSLKTLRFLKSLGDSCIITLGNHDIHLIGIYAGARQLKEQDLLTDIINAPDYAELIAWLRTRKILHYDPQLNFAMSHAGIYPLWDLPQALSLANELTQALQSTEYKSVLSKLFGNTDPVWDESLSGHDRLRFIANAFTRMRYCELPNAALELKTKSPPSDNHDPNLIPWFMFPSHKINNVNLIFGHWASLMGDVQSTPNVFAIDLGCCWGHALAALRLEDKQKITINCK